MDAEKKMTIEEAAEKGLLSQDVAEEKREALMQVIPELFTEGRIDFDQLRRVMGDWVEPAKERYGINWPGKSECIKIIQAPSVAALKPNIEESIDFDGSENLFIEGDNLEVLKLLQKPYFGKIKMIYIDPPYNTGKEFIYPDKYQETLDTYLAYTGQIDDEGRKFSTNTDAGGRLHANWLNMMYTRLYLARNLLSPDGAIFVSINDVEVANLRLVMDEIFGSENFVSQIVWQRSKRGDAKTIANIHEYILVYTRSWEDNLEAGVWRRPKEGVDDVLSHYNTLRSRHSGDHAKIREEMMAWYRNLSEDDPRKNHKHYNWSDDRGLYFAADFAGPDDGRKSRPRHDIVHPITDKVCKKPSTGWRWDETKTNWALAQSPPRIHFGEDETTIPCRKSYLKEVATEPFASVFYADGRSATLEVESLVGEGVFPFPKNREVIEGLINLVCESGDIVLDFFAGSGTTGHAAMNLAAATGKCVNFILVQLPEKIDEESKAFAAGFRNIAEVGRKRVVNASRKIKESKGSELDFDQGQSVDLGFRTFELSRSNFVRWDGTLSDSAELERQLELHINHVDPSSGSEDILYELLAKAGFELTTKVEKVQMAGKDVFSIASGALLICLDREISPDVIDAMADANPLQVICLDEGFKGNDQLKTNAVQTFKSLAKEDEEAVVFRTV